MTGDRPGLESDERRRGRVRWRQARLLIFLSRACHAQVNEAGRYRRDGQSAGTPITTINTGLIHLHSACGTGLAYRLCVGGADDGKRCNSKKSSPCASPGACTGPPLNWNLYYMGGGGYEFSPCSKTDIAAWEANPPTQCLLGLDCGDLNRSGTITATDANLALQISVGSLPFDPLGDVVPFDNPDLTVTASAASYILNVAVGSDPAPTVCDE